MFSENDSAYSSVIISARSTIRPTQGFDEVAQHSSTRFSWRKAQVASFGLFEKKALSSVLRDGSTLEGMCYAKWVTKHQLPLKGYLEYGRNCSSAPLVNLTPLISGS